MQNTGTVITVVLIVILVLLFFVGAGMMGMGGLGTMAPGMMGGYGGMMGGYGSQFGFGFNPIGAILSLVFWALVIGGIMLLVVWLARNAGKERGAPSESPLNILKVRYAKGEITKEQFEQMKRELGG